MSHFEMPAHDSFLQHLRSIHLLQPELVCSFSVGLIAPAHALSKSLSACQLERPALPQRSPGSHPELGQP